MKILFYFYSSYSACKLYYNLWAYTFRSILRKESCHSWSEYDIHLNSEVFYLSGQMKEEQADCLDRMLQAVHTVPVVSESDSLLVVSGRERVDSCISKVIASPSHTLFDECVSNLSRDASYIMVTDMEKWQLPRAVCFISSSIPYSSCRFIPLFYSFYTVYGSKQSLVAYLCVYV